MKKRGRDCLGIHRLRRDRVLRRLEGRRPHRGIGIGIRGMRVVALVVGAEGIGAMVVEKTTTAMVAKSVIRKVERRINRDSCMIRVIRLSRIRNGDRRKVLRNEGMANSSRL